MADRLACYNGRCTPVSKIPDAETGKYSYTACDGKAEGDECGAPERPDEPITKIYCCKICVNGVVKKVQSAKPCVAPAVPCTSPDPDCSAGGGEEDREGEILICAQNTCQMKKKSLFDMNNPDVQKRIASCSGKAVGAECKPFVGPPEEDRLACYNGKCTPKSKIPSDAPGKYSYTACDGKAEGDDCGGRQPCSPSNPCPEGQKCVDGKCVVTKIYCCKKCENNKVKKIESPNPCVAPYVSCDAKLDCDGDDNGENPCPEGGYRAPTVDGKMISPCDEGYFQKNNAAGEPWCCMETPPPPPEGCTGGHKLPHGSSSCEEGFELRVIDDVNWCCPVGENGKEKCSGGYKKPEGEPCMSGFHTEAFEGEPWCCPDKEEEEGEEFEWSDELKELLEMLRGRFKSLLGYESPDVLGKFRDLLDRITGGAKGLLGYESPDVMGKLGPVLDPLMKRMQYLYDYPRGLTPEERQEVINYAMKGMKRGERGQLQTSRDRLARMGLLGSKFELREAGRIGRETREGEADVRSRLAIDELDRRFQELMETTGMAAQLGQIPIGLEKWDAERIFKEMISSRALGTQMAQVPMEAEKWDAETIFNEMMGTTGAAQSMMGTFMGAETMPETLSAARRQEGYGSLDMLLRYLATMMGGQQSFLGPYMQAIMGQKTRSGSEGISNWLPYLMMMFQ